MMKKYIMTAVLIIILILELIYINNITDSISQFVMNKQNVLILPNNNYKKELDVSFLNNTDDFTPFSKQDIINIYFSVLNNGWKDFTFYCPSEYEDCINDIINISNDKDLLTSINNFVHPYNSFFNIETIYDMSGEFNIKVTRLYSDEDINLVNKKIEEIFNDIITDKMSLKEKVLAIHDYIINNTKYDIAMNKNGSNYHSNKAVGPLIEGYAICSGYTDAMALFLEKLNIPNYKISNDNHVWNGVFIDGEWYHLDLTWDDPVSDNGKDYLLHQYFLIDTEELLNISEGIDVHNFDKTVYIEFNMQKDI